MQALRIAPEISLELAARYSWTSSAAQFYGHIRRIAQQAGYLPREAAAASTGVSSVTAFGSGRGVEGRGLPRRLPA